MDELSKRPSGYKRMKARADYLVKDVAALEQLVNTLLSHLERATSPDISELERARLCAVASETRAALSDEPAQEPGIAA